MHSGSGPEPLQLLLEQLSTAAVAAAGGAATTQQSAKAAIVIKIWSQILQSDAKKEELLKLGGLPSLLSLAEGAAADREASYAACGCLSTLAAHPKCLADLTVTAAAVNRLVFCCLAMLQGPHDRSRLPAAQLLLALALQPQQVPRLSAAMPALLQLLADAGGPGWAGGRQLSTAAARVLLALLEPSEFEPEAVKQARRRACLSGGLVASLLGLAGRSGPLLLAVAACLRFIALAPEAADVLAGDPRVSCQLLELLGCGGPPGVLAYISGAVWELAAAPAAAAQLTQAGAVPALLGVVRDTALVAGIKVNKKGKVAKAKKAADAPKKAGSKDAKPDSRPGSVAAAGSAVPASVQMADPRLAAAVALCNAAGALHHLTFHDEAKQQLGASPQLPILVGLLRTTTGQTFDNVTGALWNAALLPGNQSLLAAAGAPAHLVRPLPPRWTAANTVSLDGDVVEAAAAASTAAAAAAAAARQHLGTSAAWRGS